ncbi:MAG TPA: phospholipase D-like domain-containing protein [Anaerolineaceae bacterium]|nr:phospholipase D-like domain-containing protein [Anaerolineaceae bacterium]
MNLEQLAAQHVNDFPGYQLVDAYEAGFPSYALQLQVLMQVKRPLPVLEEFILKAIDAGQTQAPQIAGLLGLEHDAVEKGLDQLQRRDYVFFQVPKNGGQAIPILITDKGRIALRELFLTEPEPGIYSVCQDALTGLLYPWQPLRNPTDIRKLDYHEIPTLVSPPSLEQLDYFALKRLVAQTQKDAPANQERRELVELMGIEKTWTAYRVMRVLQYIRPEDNAVQVQVYDRGERSMEHEAALLTMESQKRRPLRATLEKEMPPTDPEALAIIEPQKQEAARRKAVDAPRLNAEIAARQQELEQVKTQQSSELVEERREAQHSLEKLNDEIARLQAQIQKLESEAAGTEALQMHQHRPKLLEALSSAKKQVIIISPWMRPDAVDFELRQAIGETLKRGVNVMIGYGFGDPDYREERVVQNLKKLRENKKGRLRLHRIGDVHSKVLICDDAFMILSSYNWLSFSGDPTRGSRVEDGLLTQDKKAIAAKTSEWLERLAAVVEV